MIVRRRGRTRRSDHLAAALAWCLLIAVFADPGWPQDQPSASPPPLIPVPDWLIVKSRLGVAVNAAFKDAGIAIPSPQRDVTIRFPPREES
jgi:small-conductance mechanosensitive channel